MHHYKLIKRAVAAFIEELFRNFVDYHFFPALKSKSSKKIKNTSVFMFCGFSYIGIP